MVAQIFPVFFLPDAVLNKVPVSGFVYCSVVVMYFPVIGMENRNAVLLAFIGYSLARERIDRIFDDAIVFMMRGESYRGKKLETVALETGIQLKA